MPEARQCFTGAVAATNHQSLSQTNRIHRAGAGAADAIEIKATIRQQGIEDAPGKGAVRTTALQGEVEAGAAGFGEWQAQWGTVDEGDGWSILRYGRPPK